MVGDSPVEKADFGNAVFQGKELAVFEIEAEVLFAQVNLELAEDQFPDFIEIHTIMKLHGLTPVVSFATGFA